MLRVLYVDDEIGLLDIGKIFLERTGQFTVNTTPSARTALLLLGSTAYDAIISDYQMPGMDGIGFLKAVRASGNDIPFILFTGRGREEIVIQALNEGADFYLQKGGEPRAQFAELAHKVQQAARRRVAEVSLRESEEKFRTLAENAPVGVGLIQDQHYVYANPYLLRTLGYPWEELKTMGYWEHLRPDQQESVIETGRAWNRGEPGPWNHEFEYRTKNGEKGWAISTSSRTTWKGRPAVIMMMVGITGHRQAEENLRESEARFRSFVENANEIVFSLSPDGIISYVSPRWTELLGHDTCEVVGKQSMDFIHPEDLPRCREQVHAVLTTGRKGAGIEYRIRHRNGSWQWHSQSLAPVTGPDGKIVALQGICHDITERRRAAEALRESEEKFRFLVETSPDIIWERDIAGTFRYISPRVKTILGYSPEEFLGQPLTDLITDNGKVIMEKILAQVRSSGDIPQIIEIPARHRDGREVILEIRPGLDKERKQTGGIRGVAIDITDRKRMEASLQESERKFRTIVETSPNLIFEVDNTGKFLYISPVVQDILGYTPDEICTKSITDLASSDADVSIFQRALAQYLVAEGTLAPIEIPVRHRDGRTLLLEIRPGRMTGDDGRLKGFRGVAIDVTERRRVEDAIRHANRRLSLLSSVTRHDIGNQLLALRAYIKLAKQLPDSPEKMTEYLIKTEQVATVIGQQIAFTKEYEDLGLYTPRWTELDMAVPHTGIPETVNLDIAVTGISIFADPMLGRVFDNLLDNSFRHGRHITTIRVSARPSDRYLVVTWEDNGVGIPADEKELIFERGYGHNTGLGMFLIREILGLTGITITENGDPGKGARFEIVVPEGAWRRHS